MDSHIFIALVGALINMLLSVTVPCLIKKTKSDVEFLTQVKQVFETNRQVILTSSLIVGITIYLALKIAPGIEPAFNELFDFDSSSEMSDFGRTPMLISETQLPPQLRNLIKLI
jgi:phosphotransferase system  glucose/maltose/N-acetylglucosamine-specific IIC component